MLDEIGDLHPGGQAKLLRLLENKTFRRVGGVTELRADVRVLAATNVNLEERVSEGRFRADLFFRLNVVRIVMPALREHPDDVPTLCAHFIARFNQEMKRQVKGVNANAMQLLQAYRWPGNVRELRNVIERAFILHAGAEELRPEHLPPELRGAASASVAARGPGRPAAVPPDGLVLEDAEREAHPGSARSVQRQSVAGSAPPRDQPRHPPLPPQEAQHGLDQPFSGPRPAGPGPPGAFRAPGSRAAGPSRGRSPGGPRGPGGRPGRRP